MNHLGFDPVGIEWVVLSLVLIFLASTGREIDILSGNDR